MLVAIGLLLGALSIGKDLQRNAEQQKIYSQFVQGWAVAYNEYFARTGVVVGDSQTTPTLRVNGDTSLLCDELGGANSQAAGTLYALMDSVGIEMPAGRSEGREARYTYLDSNGNPQELQVCFQNVTWPDSTDVSNNNRNAMVLYGLTPDLARRLDSIIDGRADARFGLFRQIVTGTSPCNPCGAGTASLVWDRDNTAAFGAANNTAVDESQVAVVTAYYRMNQ
ncbi:MAG: prepilin-type cleavage/methylation domain-containing protein [Gammaproteobacteria bacterium]|nr:prepilin-type cleavage/methylation domain-containing protein [Gammaproteobacteria bacterium]